MPADPLDIGELARALGAEEVLSLGDLHARMLRAERERDQFREALEVAVEGLRDAQRLDCAGWLDGDDKVSFDGPCIGNVGPEAYCVGCSANATLARVESLVALPEQAEEGR